MIFIIHDLSLLTELADEIVVMYAGVLVEPSDGARTIMRRRDTLTLVS